MRKLIWILILSLLLALGASYLLSKVSRAEPFKGPDKGELPLLRQSAVWKVYVHHTFPIGTTERDVKRNQVQKVIYARDVRTSHCFVILTLDGRDPTLLLVPNEWVIYIIQEL